MRLKPHVIGKLAASFGRQLGVTFLLHAKLNTSSGTSMSWG